MSAIKKAFKALTQEQQQLVTEKRLSGARSPDEWLGLLGPVLAFDRQAEIEHSGWFARRFARHHRLAPGVRAFVAPLLAVLREDHDPACPLELTLDCTGAAHKDKATRTSDPYDKGAYRKIVDTFYDDPWLQGRAQFADGADVRFAVIDHLRSSRKTKRSASGKTKVKTKGKKKTEVDVTVAFPARNYRAVSASGAPAPDVKASVKSGEKRTVVRMRRVLAAGSADAVPDPDVLLELLGAAYARVDPSRRKKL